MTTTTTRGVWGNGSPPERGVPGGRPPGPTQSEVAALIAEAPVPRPTLIKTFNAMMAREFRVLAIQKIVAGAVQSFIGAVIVFPIVLFVHAAGQAPHVHVTNWALFALILIFASLLTSALGLLLGTIMDPRKMQMLFAVILLPATMLGCVYYPWAALHNIRWLQIAVLINPMVYMSEGLRAVLTPVLPHMPMWAVLLALLGGTVVFGYLGTRTFTKRVLN